MEHEVQRSVFTTRDSSEGLAKLVEVYALREARRASDGEFYMALTSAGTGPVTYGRLRLGGSSVVGSAEDTGTVRVGHVLEGALSDAGDRDRLPRRSPFLFPQHPSTSSWHDLDLLTVSVDGAAVAEQARQLLGAESFHLQFTGTRPVSPVMARYWLDTLAHLHRDLLPNRQVMSSPLIRSEMVRSLITALLHTFPNTFLTGPAVPEASGAAPAAIRRAVAFVDAHFDESIGLAQIAGAARMSPRGLQAAFRRELGTTPTAYLREARLEAAHRDLLAADPTTGATVEAVAARWGFAHRGRFAAAYRERFGHAPSSTLHG
ncbi:helix-turn-helix transcriptional regulator [Kocuria dechangensis]|uniref:helix-turn-helix transcriptional regulator n=1 Tax=Kocuria dechangensis TaxID=1176249 RepID=UPI00166A0D8E|nr:helix-turn-helix transcriptional regulator [Kocuria dechangensis]